ncbi:DgyrCDS10339 [Dimorphilus gyrociliatus]|uniref:DgyrCDS10339 n=1 Tax=Dimorphilus gyrociliatus TaxID=2664684 RepID=A0A7I8W139_9ANNE|nr:DgyrCDS10339 [Dimorphilus gyrociliatus]
MAEVAEKKFTVIVAIDGSEQADHAFEFYIEHMHKSDHNLLLVHSAEPPFVSSQQAMYMSGELWEQMLAAEKDKVKKLEEKFANKMRANKISGRIKAVFSGRPGELIIDLAKEEGARMIVMGTRGMGTIRRTLLGSVSDYVLHHAHCPVIICRPEDKH